MKKILSLFTLLFAFVGMAWAQETTEPFKVSDAPTQTGWAENTHWYYLKINGTKWISTDATYCDTYGNIKLMKTEKPTKDSGLWCMVKNADGTYSIYNKANLNRILGFTNGGGNGVNDRAKMRELNAQNVFTKFQLLKNDETSGYLAFRTNDNKLHIVEDRGLSGTQWLASWSGATEFTGSTARKIDFVDANIVRNQLSAKIKDAETNWLPFEGKGVGKYTAAGKEKTLETLLSEAETLVQTGTADEGEYQTAIDEIDTTIQAMSINQPIAGHFYAIKGKVNNKYIDGTTNQEKAKTTDKVDGAFKAGHLFYLTNDKKLLNYAAGYYMLKTHTVQAGEGNTWTFEASNGNVKGDNFVYYTLKSNFTGGGQYLYDHRSGANTFCDRNSKYAKNNCDWAIEEVTTLPVTVSAAGWATLYAPVALTIPTGLTGVYTAAVQGNTLKLTALNGTIPANTPVLIEANAATYNFTIDYNASAETQATGLKGTIETINKPADKTIYTLQKPNATNEIGFYKYGGTTLKGFRAYGENLLGTTTAAEGLIFDKGDVTAIENVEINDGKQTVIYDLSGRRVEKMLKGIYIVNGKKVIK